MSNRTGLLSISDAFSFLVSTYYSSYEIPELTAKRVNSVYKIQTLSTYLKSAKSYLVYNIIIARNIDSILSNATFKDYIKKTNGNDIEVDFVKLIKEKKIFLALINPMEKFENLNSDFCSIIFDNTLILRKFTKFIENGIKNKYEPNILLINSHTKDSQIVTFFSKINAIIL